MLCVVVTTELISNANLFFISDFNCVVKSILSILSVDASCL